MNEKEAIQHMLDSFERLWETRDTATNQDACAAAGSILSAISSVTAEQLAQTSWSPSQLGGLVLLADGLRRTAASFAALGQGAALGELARIERKEQENKEAARSN